MAKALERLRMRAFKPYRPKHGPNPWDVRIGAFAVLSLIGAWVAFCFALAGLMSHALRVIGKH